MKFIKEINKIYRLKVPFEDLYTSVFLIKTETSNLLVDCATTKLDVEEYIIPALYNAGLCNWKKRSRKMLTRLYKSY